MKEQYSVWAKKALKQAEKIAKQYSHYIGTEHLLAGLLAVEEGTAGLMLTEAGVTEEKLFQLIDELVAPSQTTTLERSQEYTPRTKRVLELAKSEAEKLGDKEIGTEHILIAMLKEYDCVGTRLLHTMAKITDREDREKAALLCWISSAGILQRQRLRESWIL